LDHRGLCRDIDTHQHRYGRFVARCRFFFVSPTDKIILFLQNRLDACAGNPDTMVQAILQEYNVDMSTITFEVITFFTNVSFCIPIKGLTDLDVQRDSCILSLSGRRAAMVQIQLLSFLKWRKGFKLRSILSGVMYR
jgi:hypothetical protein